MIKQRRVLASDPVVVRTGALVSSDIEFRINGPLPFDLIRAYSSSLAIETPLGRNSISSLDLFIRKKDDGLLTYLDANGDFNDFERPTPGPGLWKHCLSDGKLALAAGTDRSLILKQRGRLTRFCKLKSGIWKIEKIYDLNINETIFTYNQAEQLAAVQFANGLKFECAYDSNGRRIAVSLSSSQAAAIPVVNYAYDSQGNLIEADTWFGKHYRYEFDVAGRRIAWSDGVRSHGRHHFDDKGRVIGLTTSGPHNGDRFAYDEANRQTRFYPGGKDANAQIYQFNEKNQLISQTDALGGVTTRAYNDQGGVVEEVDPLGHVTRLQYDSNGYIRSIHDPEGRLTFYDFDEDGRLELLIDAESAAWEFEYDEKGNLVSTKDPLGNITEIVNNERGLATGIMRADGLMESYSYDANGRLIASIDFRGERTDVKRDGFGRVVAITDALGHVTRLEYASDRGGDFWTPSRKVRSDGVTVEHRFDGRKAVAVTRDGEGRVTTYRFGPFDLLEEIVDAKGGSLRFGYDGEERLTEVTNPKGLRWSFTRDANGWVISERDFDGIEQTYTYDAAGRLISSHHADGARFAYAYDKSDLLLSEEMQEPGGDVKITRYSYDYRGLLKEARNDWAHVELTRDKFGREVSESVNGRKVERSYDCCGNQVKREIGGRLVEMLYDPLGAIKRLTIDGRAPLEFARDAVGRELRRESRIGFSLEQAFDPVGQLLKQAAGRTSAGLIGAPADSKTSPGKIVERNYSWSKAFEPLSIADGLWGETSYVYDRSGQVTDTRFGDGGGERFSYDPMFNIVGSSSGATGGAIGSRLEGWLSSVGGQVKAGRGPNGEKIFLSHDLAGRVIERRIERDGFRPKVWRYGWDGKDRLIHCMTPEGETWRYGYDPFGRRIFKRKELNEDERRYFSQKFPPLIERSAYDAYNYGASYMNERPRKGLGSNAAKDDGRPPVVGTAYLWDNDVVAEEAPLRLDGAVDWDAATRWHYEPETFRPLAKEEPYKDGAPGRLLYIVADHLGTPREMFSEDGTAQWAASYTTWGVVRAVRTRVPGSDPGSYASWENGGRRNGPESEAAFDGNLALRPAAQEEALACPIRFQGQWEDEENGLYYNRFRYYDPVAVCYISRDPIGIHGGYRVTSYIASPSTSADPLGLWGCSQVTAKVTAGEAEAIGKSTKEFHAEINALRKLNEDKLLQGKDVVISDITGWADGGRKTVGMCAECRSNIFDPLIAGGANSVTIPYTTGNTVQGTLRIERTDFENAQKAVEKARLPFTKDQPGPRSDAAWKALHQWGKYTPC